MSPSSFARCGVIGSPVRPSSRATAMGMRVAENGTFYVLTVFVLAYIEGELGMDPNTGLVGVIIAAASHRQTLQA